MTAIPETISITTRRGNQTYRRVAIEPCQRRNGRPSRFVVWRSTCRRCGGPFYVTSGASKRALAKGPGTVHCPAHRRSTTAAAIARDADFARRYGEMVAAA